MLNERVLVLVECLKKKDAPRQLYKNTTENISLFNCKQVFVVRTIVEISNKNCLCWISKEGGEKIIDKGILRQELIALKNQFV